MRVVRISRANLLVFLRSVGSAAFLFGARAVAVIYQLRFANQAFGISYGGLIALLNQITFYILLAELGLAAATTSLLFEPAHRGDHVRVNALMKALQLDVRKIVLFLSPLSAVVCLGLTVGLHRQIPAVPLLSSLLLTCISALITFMALPFQSHFNATDRVPLRNFIIGCGFALKVIVGVLLAMAMHSFIGLPLGIALIGICEYAAQRYFVLRELEPTPVTEPMLVAAQASIRSRAKFVLAHRIGYLFTYQSDYVILLLSSSLSLLGYYAQYQYIYAGVLSFSIGVGGTWAARLAKRQLDIGQVAFSRLYRKISALIISAAIVCALGFYLFVDTAVHVLYRTVNYDHKAVVLFAILLMLNIYKINDDLWIDTTGMYHKLYYLPILEATTYIILGLIFVRHFHMVGVLYAGIVGNLIFSVILKSFVIGNGVMRCKTGFTIAVKFANLAAASLLFYLVFTLVHLMTFLRPA